MDEHLFFIQICIKTRYSPIKINSRVTPNLVASYAQFNQASYIIVNIQKN